ncbi:hypothetical protein HBB16_11150 [Pseudonocardia sp. MCCB 268]|nr:hypothetical protein [Pseudonocardia cytotoxica]
MITVRGHWRVQYRHAPDRRRRLDAVLVSAPGAPDAAESGSPSGCSGRARARSARRRSPCGTRAAGPASPDRALCSAPASRRWPAPTPTRTRSAWPGTSRCSVGKARLRGTPATSSGDGGAARSKESYAPARPARRALDPLSRPEWTVERRTRSTRPPPGPRSAGGPGH